MQNEITLKQLRTLNENERETLREALQMLADTHCRHRWSAQSMLDQNMVDNFMWATK